MPIEGITCDKCGSSDVIEYKPETYICRACDHRFKYVDPTRSEVEIAPQFCEEGCGNLIKYKCALCGKMVCEKHGGRAKILLSRWTRPTAGKPRQTFADITLPELQQAWCLECFNNMSDGDKPKHFALILKDSDRYVRRDAADALGIIGDPSAIPYLAEALKDTDSVVRWNAVRALGKIGDPSAIPYLAEALKDTDYKVGSAAISALGKTGDPSAVPYLAEVLKGSDSRTTAAYALGRIGTQGLAEALKDADYRVRRSAISGLGNVGPSAIPYLAEALKDAVHDVRRAAANALENIGDPRGLEAATKARKRWDKGKPYCG